MQVKILGKDMEEKVIEVNGEDGKIDITAGKYDVDMSIEGSYSTQREEFQEKLSAVLPQLPEEHRAIISDILFEMQDFHRAGDVAERLKAAIKAQYPGIIQNTDDELNEEGDNDNMTVDPGTGQLIPVNPGEEAIVPGNEPIDPAQQAEIDAQNQALENEQRAADTEASIQDTKLKQEEAKLEGLNLDNHNKKQLTKSDTLALLKQVLDELPIENKQQVLNALRKAQSE